MKNKYFLLSLISLVIIFLAILVYLYRIKTSGYFYGATDFFKFYESVRFYFSGQNLYSSTIIEIHKNNSSTWMTADGNLNPPFLTLLLLPFYYFNYAISFKLWTIGSIICLLFSAWLVLKPFKTYQKYTLPIIAALLIYVPSSETLAYGQITNYILILLITSWLFARENHDIPAGVLIGLACSIKLFCGLFLVYFLCIKRFKLFLYSVISGLFTFLISLWVFGSDNYLSYHKILNKIAWYASSWNVSFLGFFTRLFSTTEKNHALINLPQLVQPLTILCSILLLIYLIYTWLKLNPQKFDWGFSLVIIAMLLLSPLGWSYYFAFLMIPYLVLIHDSQNDIVHLLLCILLLFSMLTGDLLKTPEIKTTAEVIYFGGIGFYILLSFLGLYIFTRKPSIYKLNISENLWLLIYGAVFSPSLLSLAHVTKNLVRLNFSIT